MDWRKKQQKLAAMMADIRQGALKGRSITQIAQSHGLPGPAPQMAIKPLPAPQSLPSLPAPQMQSSGGPPPALRFSLFKQALEGLGHFLDPNAGRHDTITVAPPTPIDLKNIKNLDLPQYPAQIEAKQLANDAAGQYGLTPQFKENVNNAYPYVGKPPATKGLTNPNAPVGEYFGGGQRSNQIVISHIREPNPALGKMADENTIVHEGLHRVWDTNPKVRKQFAAAYDEAVKKNPELATNMQFRVSGYSDAQKLMDAGGVFTNDFKKLESLPPSIQNEIHSYLANYYMQDAQFTKTYTQKHVDTFKKMGLLPADYKQGQSLRVSGPLQRYYSQFIGNLGGKNPVKIPRPRRVGVR